MKDYVKDIPNVSKEYLETIFSSYVFMQMLLCLGEKEFSDDPDLSRGVMKWYYETSRILFDRFIPYIQSMERKIGKISIFGDKRGGFFDECVDSYLNKEDFIYRLNDVEGEGTPRPIYPIMCCERRSLPKIIEDFKNWLHLNIEEFIVKYIRR